MTGVIDRAAGIAHPVAAPSDQLEWRLRRFRARELANRRPPTGREQLVDAASRLVPQVAGYAAVITLARPYALIGAVVFAIGSVSLGSSWFHDGVHRNIRAAAPISWMLSRLGSAPFGLSPRWWFIKHVRLHHRYPGNAAFDPDIQFVYVARVVRDQRWRRQHATQHWHMWLLYPLTTLNMLRPSEAALARHFQGVTGVELPTARWPYLVDKYLPMAVVWTPVLLVRGWFDAALAFLVFHVVAGVLAALITQIQHNTALSDIETAGQEHPLCEQLLRSTDVGGRRGVWWWLSGGSSFHVVHHLAPSLTFLELPAATARLRAELREIQLDVPTHRGLGAAIRSHALLLRRLGVAPQ